jgi:aspartate 1-decarboxylase
MIREMCKSKIHRARVTDANLNYTGSITIDRTLMDLADLLPYEKVQVVNLNTGARFETYVIEGFADSGTICLNGAAARLVQINDLVIIIAYGHVDSSEAVGFTPRIVWVDPNNRPVPQPM